MAKTLKEAGGQTEGGVLPTSSAVTQQSRIATPTIKVGDSLSKDLLSVMGTAGNIVQETNTLSVKAAQRVATDSLTQMSIDLSAINGEITPETDLREVQAANEAVYQFYGRKTFDNDDAQLAFDNQYHNSAAPAIANTNSKLEQQANKIDATKLFNGTVDSVSAQINSGITLDSERFNQYVETMTSGKYFTPEQAGSALVKILNQSIEGTYETLDDLDVYNRNGIQIDINKLDAEASKHYSAIATIENGEWTPKSGVPVSVVQSAQNTFNKLIDNNRKGRTQKLGYSAIPDANSGTKLDGSTDYRTALARSKSAWGELQEKVRLNPDIVHENKFKSWEVNQQKLDAKARILGSMTVSYNDFATGKITWQDYLNNTAKTTQTFTFEGQEIAISASEGDVTSFAQKQFDNYDDELRGSNYSEIVGQGKGNPFSSAANVEIQSGGALKSNYLQRNAVMLAKGNIVADSFQSLQSEYHKTIDYMNGKTTLDNTWLTQTNRDNVNAMFVTLSDRVKNGELNETQAFVKAKSTMEAWENTINFKKQKVDSEKLIAMNEAFKSLDAETANDEGWVNMGLGDEVYPNGTKALFVQKFQGDITASTDPKAMTNFVVENVVPLRSRSGAKAWVFGTLPWRKTFMLYTGGRGDVTQDGASFAIAQRIEKDLGKKFADITDDTLTVRQDNDDNGETVTTVAVRTGVGGTPLKIYTFSMDELAKGEVNLTDKELELGIKPEKTKKQDFDTTTILKSSGGVL